MPCRPPVGRASGPRSLRCARSWSWSRHFVVGAGRSGFYVNDDRIFDVDQVIEPVTKLDTFIGFRGPGRTRVHWRNRLRHLAIGVGIFVIKGSEELGHRPRLTFRRRPVDLVRSLAMITAGIRFHDAGIDGEGLPLTRPAPMHVRTTASNTWRNRSLSR